ncbi:MAG: UTP--glucose-1-phosphate uridylyltransferase [Chloroflexi bacterium]|jgi:UTP--glucose-1-phosphate uridylyltransferase|nr:MAG: UTP--glucose-1-phosphate uridylyltransferase [Chloroflexota bacterium]
MKVRKAVVAAAGFGTRFLPASKSVPKEMLALLDRPLIHYAAAEAAASGIEHLIIITSRGKESMADYFDRAPDLEAALEAKGRSHLLAEVRELYERLQPAYVRQHEQLGLGHAVLSARKAVGDEPFAVFLPDDIIVSDRKPALAQMLEVFEKHQGSVVAVQSLPREDLPSYGVVDPEPVADRVTRVKGLVEKPKPEDAPSNLGIVGRYIFTPEIFDCLERTQPGSGGEIQLTDGMALLAQQQPMFAYEFEGTRFDTGNPLGMLKATVTMALQRDDMASDFREWLKGQAL